MVDKGTTPARRSRPAHRLAPRGERNKSHSGKNKVNNNVNVALPFSIITTEEAIKLKVGDWVSLAGLVTSVVGFCIVIRQLIRIANASAADQASDRANREEPDSLAGQSSSPDAGSL
jgi:hypothetical protein